jgi:hypothetical protein
MELALIVSSLVFTVVIITGVLTYLINKLNTPS